jgi:hypothetical protein
MNERNKQIMCGAEIHSDKGYKEMPLNELKPSPYQNLIGVLDPAQQDLVYRLRKRAEIRRQIPGRKSVEEGKADRIADILEEAANEIERLRKLEPIVEYRT